MSNIRSAYNTIRDTLAAGRTWCPAAEAQGHRKEGNLKTKRSRAEQTPRWASRGEAPVQRKTTI